MTLQELEQKIITETKKYEAHTSWTEDIALITNVYDKIMYKLWFNYSIPYFINSNLYIHENRINLSDGEFDLDKTQENILEWIRNCENKVITKITGWLIWTPDFVINLDDMCVYSSSLEIPKELLKCVVFKQKNHTYNYVINDGKSFNNKTMYVKSLDINLNMQYNDTLPVENINNFIKSESSGIAIFHGTPGCGKTTYLRYLISNNPNINFYVLDSSMFAYITSAQFIDYLTYNKNGIFILEDCESLLISRDGAHNNMLSSLLNISDGMLGDELNLKFICTFNTNLKNIDPALLRKGRLKVKYEFDKLDKDKAQNLINSLSKNYTVNEPMALCDIYNLEENTGVVVKKKIGF